MAACVDASGSVGRVTSGRKGGFESYNCISVLEGLEIHYQSVLKYKSGDTVVDFPGLSRHVKAYG